MKNTLKNLKNMQANEIIEIVNNFDETILEQLNLNFEECKEIFFSIESCRYVVAKQQNEEYKQYKEEWNSIFKNLENMEGLDENDDLWFSAFYEIEKKQRNNDKRYTNFARNYTKLLNAIEYLLYDLSDGIWNDRG